MGATLRVPGTRQRNRGDGSADQWETGGTPVSVSDRERQTRAGVPPQVREPVKPAVPASGRCKDSASEAALGQVEASWAKSVECRTAEEGQCAL